MTTMWWDHGMSGWWYAGMAVGMVLFWTLIVVGIIALTRFSTGASQPRAMSGYQPQRESPEQLLASRFARGEIDEGEYQQCLAVLRSTGQR
jgi:putative membrane protein